MSTESHTNPGKKITNNLLRAILTWVSFVAAAMIPVMIVGLIPGVDSLPRFPFMLITTVQMSATLALYILATWLLQCKFDRQPFINLGLVPHKKDIKPLVVAILMTGTLLLIADLVMIANGGTPAESEITAGKAPAWAIIWLVLLLAFVLQGIGEELLFRGYLMQNLRLRPVGAVVGAAVAFAIPHLISQGGQEGIWGHIAYLAIPFGFGLLAGALAIRFNSLWAAIGVHAGFHLANTLADALGIRADGNTIFILMGALFTVAGIAVFYTLPQEMKNTIFTGFGSQSDSASIQTSAPSTTAEEGPHPIQLADN